MSGFGRPAEQASDGRDQPATERGAAEPERLLTQDEIDSLLDFGPAPAQAAERSGIERIVRSGLVSYERLPMLELVFDGLVRIMSTSLRNLTGENVEVGIDEVTSLRFNDYVQGISLPAVLAVFRAEEWDNLGLLVIDSAMVYAIVDVLLGGGRTNVPMRIEGRPFTTIERTLVEQLARVVLADLTASFDPLCPVTFKFERLEVNPSFAAISRAASAAVVARLRVELGGREGRLELLLPYATLEPVRELLLQRFMGEKFGRDAIWETHLADELRGTEVELEAVLDEQEMRLSDVIALKPGSRVMLSCTPGAPVQLRCGRVRMFDAKLGHRKNRVAVRIE